TRQLALLVQLPMAAKYLVQHLALVPLRQRVHGLDLLSQLGRRGSQESIHRGRVVEHFVAIDAPIALVASNGCCTRLDTEQCREQRPHSGLSRPVGVPFPALDNGDEHRSFHPETPPKCRGTAPALTRASPRARYPRVTPRS